MKKLLSYLMVSVLALSLWSCSSSDDDAPVVGIATVTLTPKGSAVSYNAIVSQATNTISNADDPFAWDVTDAAIEQTTVKATATLGATVYCNGAVLPTDGVTVDLNGKSVTLEVKDASGKVSRAYTLTAVRSTEAGSETMVIKSSQFQGFPSGVISYDMVNFKGMFYAYVVSVNGETENYEIYNSVDGVNWSKVDYQCAGADKFLVGGEGASIAVLNDKLFVIGGIRTKGKDILGNEAEVSNGWLGPEPKVYFRVYSSTDGVTFTDETANVKATRNGVEVPEAGIASALGGIYYNAVTFGNKLYLRGGYMFGFGSWQSKRLYANTADGINWEITGVLPSDLSNPVTALCASFFEFKGKLWTIGGFSNYYAESNLSNKICSSSDGINWTEEGTLPESMNGLIGAAAVVDNGTIYLIGGQIFKDGAQQLTNQIFTSTDGINWTATDSPATFAARRSATVVGMDNVAWIFGGYKNASTGNYVFPDGNDGELLTDTWAKLMK